MVGTAEGLQATGVYLDLVSGLKRQVADLRMEKRLWQAVGLICLLGLIALMPLRKRIPFFYEVNSATGEVRRIGAVAEEVKISDKNAAFFLRIWATRLININAGTLREGLPAAYRWTRGSAQTALDEWTEKEDRTAERIAKTPGLTREILGVPTVSFNEERTIALIDLTWLEKVNGVERDRRRKLLTVEYGLDVIRKGTRSAAESIDDSDNPLGLVITHFTINDQVAQ